MGSEDNGESNLYYTVNGMTGMIWSGLQSFTLESIDEPEAADYYCDHLPFLEGTISFTIKDPYISRKLLRPARRWSRKKAQQQKRKRDKEKSMAWYMRQPELVEAVQWNGENIEEIFELCNKDGDLLAEVLNEISVGEYVIVAHDDEPGMTEVYSLPIDVFMKKYQPDSCNLDGSGCE